MFKKALALICTAALCFSLVGCGSNSNNQAGDNAEESAPVVEDLKAIKDKGEIVIGITDFEPMDYKDENGNWIWYPGYGD